MKCFEWKKGPDGQPSLRVYGCKRREVDSLRADELLVQV